MGLRISSRDERRKHKVVRRTFRDDRAVPSYVRDHESAEVPAPELSEKLLIYQMTATIADQIIAILRDAGVRHVYGLVGDSLNPIADAIRRDGSIRWIHVHNEEAAAFAACAEAQLTGKLAVCAGSCGPGNTHLIQGLFDAHRTGAAVLALASDIPSKQVDTGFFQETHPERLFVECSGFVASLHHPSQMPRLLYLAIRHALARGDVATLIFPGDVAALDAENPEQSTDLVGRAPNRVATAGADRSSRPDVE